MRTATQLRLFSVAALLGLLLPAVQAHAASTATVRAAQAARLARSTSGMPGGGFAGMVPGLAITDPVSISTTITAPTTFDFGDGTVVTYQLGETPAHTYTQPGFYKPIISSKTLGTVTLAFQVPFDSNQPNIFGLGTTYGSAGGGALSDPIQFLSTFDGTATLDFGDGTPPVTVDSSTDPTHVYGKAGEYTATFTVTNTSGASQTGAIRFMAPLSDKNTVGKLPGISITALNATPNPAKAGGEITFSGAFSVSNVSAELSGVLDFGDGSAPFTAAGTPLSTSMKGQITHTYAADGVYKAVLDICGGGAEASADLYVVIGSGTAVNSLNGLISSAQVSAGGVANLQLIVSSLTGATTATTTFDDTLGRADPVDGLLPSRTFTAPALSVATSIAKDAAGNELGKIRKTIVVGAADVGDSTALPAPPSREVKISKLAGKFAFGKGTADQVSVSGSIQLPAGFNPAQAGGNPLVIGVGNIVDTVTIDAKGKPGVPTGLAGRLKKASVKYPKLSGPALGGEVAQVGLTLSLPNMSVAGFDTEGISNTLRPDEKRQKAVPRFVQVSLLFGGVPYEIYAPVTFKLSAKGDAGQIATRKQ